jgi:hypothetical protein
MIIGHVGAALVARRFMPRVPIPALLFATFLPDLLRVLLTTAGMDNDMANLYTHALPWSVASVVVAAAVLWFPKRDRDAALAGACLAASHIALDLISGNKALWAGGPTGLDLGDTFWQNEFAIESCLLLAGWTLLQPADRLRWKGWRIPSALVALELLALLWGLYTRPTWQETCPAYPYQYCDGSSWVRTAWRQGIPAAPRKRELRLELMRDSIRRARRQRDSLTARPTTRVMLSLPPRSSAS